MIRAKRTASAFIALVLGIAAVGVVISKSQQARASDTATPIKHVVVIYQENVSFDHYFGTYPNAVNPQGEPAFRASPNTPLPNGLSPALLTHNPNTTNPFRFDRSQGLTCDQRHDYKPEQQAFDSGKMDKFVQYAGSQNLGCDPKQVMGYYDGNTVTGLWNYAQHFALSDNSYSSTFGPSTPGALNLISGQTHGATPPALDEKTANGTVIGDADPAHDDCSKSKTLSMSGQNIGDKLNQQGRSWGWFEGGFKPTQTMAVTAFCGSSHKNIDGTRVPDYEAHHEPFQYYSQTANPHHLPPSSQSAIGKSDQANHQYDLSNFWQAADANNLPDVSFLKAPAYEDAHPGNSDPLDEQRFLVDTLNRLQRLSSWRDTAVVVAYDDSDGWYDHQMSPIVNPSSDPKNDAVYGNELCGRTGPGSYQDRCGYGPRQPLLVISPFAKPNFIDHTSTDQASILRFVEDNWNLGRIADQSFDQKAASLDSMFDFSHPRPQRVFVDPTTGEVSGK
jgi:phospholipase C